MPSPHLASLLEDDPVVITGVGAISAAGPNVNSLWDAVEQRRSGARLVEYISTAGEVQEWAFCPPYLEDWSTHPWGGMARRLELGGQLALAAGFQAVSQAGLTDSESFEPDRCGVIIGSSRGPKGKWEEIQEQLRTGRRLKPTAVAASTLGASAGALAQMLGARGPSWLVSTACASGAYALIQAAEQIALGNADVMVVGGADDVFSEAVLTGLHYTGVLARNDGPAEERCRPFCSDRTGFVPGSGAGMFVMESAAHARKRGAIPLAIFSGWSALFAPEGLAGIASDGTGLVRVMTGALEMAGLDPEEIGYVNAHGTGTPANDIAEAAAIHSVFRDNLPPCSSSKPITGHCLGATPALEAILCVEALRRQRLPPAFPIEPVDPRCSVHLSAGGAAPGLRHLLSNSAAFWGFHASLIFSRPDDSW